MTQGPLGGPRPLATGDIVILVTVKEDIEFNLFNPEILENDMEIDGWNIKDANLDVSARTYGINTGLDAIEIGMLNKMVNDTEQNIKDLAGNNSIKGTSVGFK